MWYVSMRKEHHCQHVENGVYKTLRDCCEYGQKEPADKHRQLLQLFPANQKLEFVETDILGPLLNSFKGH